MKNDILNIQNLDASIGDKKILKNFNLNIKENEIHYLIGPNGSGKSTLSKLLAGSKLYKIDNGIINFLNDDLCLYDAEIRSHKGIFLSFQHPLEIHGVSTYDFLRNAYNEKQLYQKKIESDPITFLQILEPFLKSLKMDAKFLSRDLNQGFSGGEKKKHEILQMLLLNPKLIILDEIDSGLDIEALKIIINTILKFFPLNSAFLIITHNINLIKLLPATKIHIIKNGTIVKTGNNELLNNFENNGFNLN